MFLLNSLDDFEIEYFRLIIIFKFQIKVVLNKIYWKISRSLLEPVKVEQDKIYPMFTFLNDKGDIDWEFLN